MLPLSAVDAIAPALTRTRQLLFSPFRIGRSWKLAVCQYLGFMGALFLPFPLAIAFLPLPFAHDPPLRVYLGLFIALSTALLFGLFYVGVRMQFVDLEMVITRHQFIAPMWRRHSARVWPMLAFKAVIGTLLFLLFLPLFWRAVIRFSQLALAFPASSSSQPPDPQLVFQFIAQMAGFYVLVLLTFLLLKLVSTLIEDFALPFYVLEQIPLFESIRRGFRILVAEPLHCLFYLGMKLLLSIAGFIAQYVLYLLLLIPFILVAVIIAVIAAATHVFAGVGHLGLTVVGGALYLAFIALMFWYQLGSFGCIFLFLEAYAIYFLAGRYPLLASLLEPAPEQPFTPPPPPPSPEEDDDGPPFPMDPALA